MSKTHNHQISHHYMPILMILYNDTIKENASEQEFRQQILQNFTNHKTLDLMFETVKDNAQNGDKQ